MNSPNVADDKIAGPCMEFPRGTRVAKIFGIALATSFLLARSAFSASVSPRELFELGGVGREQLAALVDGEPWKGGAGNELIRRMLYRIAQDVRPGDLADWSLGDVDLERIARDPGAYRVLVFQLRGRALLVEPYDLSEGGGEAGDFASIWRCRMRLDSDDPEVDVFTGRVPKAWRVGQAIDEPAGATAFFLKTSQMNGEGPAAYFLADRMAWYPPTYLGRLGMDVGLLDDVPVEPPPKPSSDGSKEKIDWETRQLTERDHECFYQMLKAVGSAREGQLSRWAQEELARNGKTGFSVVPLFNEPQTQQGKLVELTGVARRILPVRVDETDVQDRLGVEEYYQVYLFTEDSQDNPIVFCLRELPEGLPVGDGPGFGEKLSVAGFFLMTWSYPLPVSEGKAQRQLAPLLIGKSAKWYPEQAPSELSPTQRFVGLAVLLAVLGVVWWIFRQFGRGDREFARRVRHRVPPEVAEMDWDTLDASAERDSK